MQPQQLSTYRTLSDPQLHPDGERVAFTVSRMNIEDDRYDKQIFLWDGSVARPFTHGPGDGRPRWSPDGSQLAFLRAGPDPEDKPQVAVMPAGGGEARIISDFPLGAREAEWSPDGSRLAVVGAEWTDEWSEVSDEERERLPRRIVRAGYRFDNHGWIHDRRANVWLIDVESGEGTRLSVGDVFDSAATWRPDGEAVVFVSARHERRFLEPGSQVFSVSVGGGDIEPLSDLGFWSALGFDPEGHLYALGLPDQWSWPGNAALWRLEEGKAFPTAPEIDRPLVGGFPSPAHRPAWAGGRVWTHIEDSGSLSVLAAGDDGADVVVGGRRVVSGFTVDAESVYFVASTPTNPGELYRLREGEETMLTDLNAGFREDDAATMPEHFTISRDDELIDVWVYLPAGDDPVPGLLNVHGGPASQYGWGFFDEFQVYVDGGYAVIACNPRGSSGKATESVRAPVGRWTEDRPPDLDDVLAALDEALERHGRIDRGRLGIMGGSYGGFLTTRILAVDHRFQSAVPERGLYDFTSFAGTSDIGSTFPVMYLGEWSHDDWSRLWAASPLSRAHDITTPCLILHSEQDFRCPIEQAEQLFMVLVQNGVEVEFLRFPGESHELSRSGKPKHRVERFDAILDWHDRHLQTER